MKKFLALLLSFIVVVLTIMICMCVCYLVAYLLLFISSSLSSISWLPMLFMWSGFGFLLVLVLMGIISMTFSIYESLFKR